MLHLHYTNILGELFLKCVIVLGNTAHEASITHSWVTRHNIRGELTSVKTGLTTPDNYANALGNLARSPKAGHNEAGRSDFRNQ